MRARDVFPTLAVLALSTAFVAAGCSRRVGVPATSAGPTYFGAVAPLPGQVFRFGNGAEPERLDPGLISGQPDGRIARCLYEGLLISDPRTLEPLPGQAQRWEISEDRRTYIFHLRPGLLWTNGQPVRAQDFEWSWKRVLDPKTASRYAGLLSVIENAEAYNKGEFQDAARVGIRAMDDSTLVVHLAEPDPVFLYRVTYYTFLPVYRPAIERWGDRWTRPEHIVSNGPFTLHRHQWRAVIEMERNPRYWDAAHVRLERILAYPVDDKTTLTNMYKAGIIDWEPSGYIPAPFLPFMKGYADFRTGFQHAVYFYSINTKKPPLDNVWVRRALAQSLDRATIAGKVLKGTRPPWGLFCPSGYEGYHPPAPMTYDLAKAREDLTRAGFPGGKGFPKIEILFNTDEDHRRIAEAVQAMWKQGLGIRVGLENQEWGTYLDNVTQLRYNGVARRSWIGDYPDPSTFLDCFRTGDGNNRTGWSNAQYDALLREAQKEPDAARRLELLSRAEKILLDEAPVIPIYHYVTNELVKPYVRGLYPTTLDFHPLKFVWIDHDWRSQPTPVAESRVGGGDRGPR